MTAGYSLLTLLPQFALDHGQITERQIGLVFAFNTGVIVLAQLPISRTGSRASDGRGRAGI